MTPEANKEEGATSAHVPQGTLLMTRSGMIISVVANNANGASVTPLTASRADRRRKLSDTCARAMLETVGLY